MRGGLRTLAIGFALVLVHLAAVLIHYVSDPAALGAGYLGRVSYGAYQETLWWYDYLAQHLFQPRSWFHTDLQGYPFGVDPYELYAGDLVAPLLFAPLAAVLPLSVATNLFILALLVANGLAACWAVRALGGGWLPAVLSGVLFACNPYVAVQIEYGRLSLLLLFPIPLFAVAWIRSFGEAAGRWPIAATLLLALTFWVYPYYGLFAALAAPLLPLAVPGPPKRYLGKLAALFVGAALLVALPMWPLLSGYGEYTTYPESCQAYAPCATDLPGNFDAMFEHSLWVTDLPGHADSPLLWIGLLGLFGPRRVRVLAALSLGAAILAMGPFPVGRLEGGRERCLMALPLPYGLVHRVVPGMEGFSHPLRFLGLGYALGALALGGLLQAWLARLKLRWSRRTMAVLAILVVAAVLGRRAPVSVEAPPPVPEALATLGDGAGPLLLLPLQSSDVLLFSQLDHRRPLFNRDGLMVPYKTGDELAHPWETNGFLGMLRDLDAGAARTGVAGAQFFTDHGFEHVVFCRHTLADPWSFGEIAGLGWGSTPEAVEAHAVTVLSSALGPAVYQDRDLIVFALPP